MSWTTRLAKFLFGNNYFGWISWRRLSKFRSGFDVWQFKPTINCSRQDNWWHVYCGKHFLEIGVSAGERKVNDGRSFS